MTLKELLEKNERIKKEREAQKILKEEEKEPVKEQKTQTSKKGRGKKPANRQYMVVDQDVIEQYEDSEEKVEPFDVNFENEE